RNGFQDLYLLVTKRLAVDPSGRLHREMAHDLEQMILNDVANRPGLIVKSAPALDPKVLGHRDLDAVDLVPVPKRLHERIGKTKHDQVVDGPLPEIMIDAEN